jgi:CRP-like cAMP-binding protein
MKLKRRNIEHLRQIPLFSRCTDPELERISQLVTLVRIREGEKIVGEGKPGSECFVIEDGRASVSLRGRRIECLGPGDIFGEMALIDQGPRSATVIADTEMSAYVIDARGFETLVEVAPHVRKTIMETLSKRLRLAERAVTA